ncbi:MAG: hypothetical protein A3J93_00855 [Candidatus Magasanikbacteria bacterium RIFOXYC2_FULL_42_28]|uniref:PGAP1 family protein n=1 Tax=Candidatus Magasanikbacteria bacterium RIFOXYC2_FULL_42_28 TaxID=1798704 RepID=A0A1F6NXH4_9BACT|nr:MAG: hypothetical protein A3J93_00855 [Candidatus Magasanikbacteria bacterium RIFOXYC2_FULL_42_28]
MNHNFWSKKVMISVAFFVAFLFAPLVIQAAIIIPDNQPPTLSHTYDQANLYIDEQPYSWYISSVPDFKMIYTDQDNDAPLDINVVIDGASYPMIRNASADQCWLGFGPNGEENYLNCGYYGGIEYIFTSSPTLVRGHYSFHFETTDSFGNSARLPASGEYEVNVKSDPVIIIPGVMGSEQKNGEWVIDPIFHTYDNLVDTFVANGYRLGYDLFTFPYEWRQSNVDTAFQLKEKIDEVKENCQCDKVDLVGHSMGGLVARQYIQSDDYIQDVDQLIFLGTPHLGAPASYLTWEAEEFGVNIEDNLKESFFSREAKKSGYMDIFDYVHREPIASAQELLPIYDYLKDKSTGQMRAYPNNYPVNPFLEELNANIDRLFNSGVSIFNIVGNLDTSNTINTIRVVDSPIKPVWEDGFPDGYDGTTADLGLELGDGDDTVPLRSSRYVSAYNNDLRTVVYNSGHRNLPTEAEKIIIGQLSDINDPVEVNHSYFPNVKILLIKILSPADIVVIAPDGKRVGKDFNTGEEFNEIEGAFYSGFATDNEYITVPNPLDGEYKIQAQGTGDGGEYTIVASYVSDSQSVSSNYQSTILSDEIADLEFIVDNAEPSVLEVKPAGDTISPIVTINSPLAQNYTRVDSLAVSVSSTDADSGIQSQVWSLDGKIVVVGEPIDLFTQKLGNHIFFATATDFAGNTATATIIYQLIATPSSTIADIEKMFILGWIKNLSTKNSLINKLKNAIRLEMIIETIKAKPPKFPAPRRAERIERLTQRIDKILGLNFLRELTNKRDKAITAPAYAVLLEDLNWLLNN